MRDVRESIVGVIVAAAAAEDETGCD